MKHVCSRSNYWYRTDEPKPRSLIALYRDIYESCVFSKGLRVYPLKVLTCISPHHNNPLGSRGFFKLILVEGWRTGTTRFPMWFGTRSILGISQHTPSFIQQFHSQRNWLILCYLYSTYFRYYSKYCVPIRTPELSWVHPDCRSHPNSRY